MSCARSLRLDCPVVPLYPRWSNMAAPTGCRAGSLQVDLFLRRARNARDPCLGVERRQPIGLEPVPRRSMRVSHAPCGRRSASSLP
eukprot:scaffold19768_cov128-Isochrysis_galbana.AAC.5